jgi:AbrB family looped-hinge helix DNA binding protein
MTSKQGIFESRVFSKGRTTIPKEIREAINLHGATRVLWEIIDGWVKVVSLIEEPQRKPD